MPFKTKRWKTEIWLEDRPQPAIIYGDSLATLRHAAKSWLFEHHPQAFSNTFPHYPIPEQRKKYLYSDGTREIPVFSLYSSTEHKVLSKGWYRLPGDALFPQPVRLESFEHVVTSFVEKDIIAEAGPDYKHGVKKIDPSCVMRLIAHPALLAAAIGLATASCYLAVPIYGGSEKNFILASSNVLIVIAFIVMMMLCFLGIGYGLYKGMAVLETAKEQKAPPTHRG
ncbi:MAG: hypothetical protein KDJ65_32635 [Anaerolineae bacterium]|nr:hypothetical protein [Anaerolineae bacterium]